MSSYYLSEDLARFGDMAHANPKLFDLFMKWYGSTMEKGALDERTKKLIALAVSFAIQEPYCIDSYASACTDAGITPEEMSEAVNVAAAIRGGGTIAHWVQASNTMARKG
jgi:alkylhydroperoxidase/carboxymuconolactone decarboxylase family protein